MQLTLIGHWIEIGQLNQWVNLPKLRALIFLVKNSEKQMLQSLLTWVFKRSLDPKDLDPEDLSLLSCRES